MSNQAFELAILISLKDAASAGADRVSDRLRSMGKDGKAALNVFESLRKDLKQGLVLGGVGVAGLSLLKNGAQAAGDFEAALADLRLAYTEVGKDGAIDMAKLGDQMNRLELLSVRLGNALPGNTQMFVEMLAQLRQGGLDAETVLNGAGEAAANLAVVTGQVPKDLAKDFSQFGMQFKLKPDEYVKAADLFARIKARTDLGSSELIMGSKYFQLRAGAPLGLKGLEGAETGARLMAAMKRVGLEGSVAGTGTADFFKEIADPKKLKGLKKDFGIDLQFFDKKGAFLGIDNAFKQMEKLRSLSTQKRMTGLDKLAGSEGAAVGNAMTDMGLQGWKDIGSELDKTASLQEQINQKTATYNAKLEAVQGTLDNLKATAFTPLLDTLKPILDTTNSIIGSVQEWAKEHQTIAGFATKLIGMSSAALIVVGSFKAMTTTWQLWRLASAVGSGEPLLAFLQRTRTEAAGAGLELEKSAAKAGRFSGMLSRIPPAVKTTITIIGIEYAATKVSEIYNAFKEMRQAQAEQEDSAKSELTTFQKLRAALKEQGKPMPKGFIEGEATSALANLNQNRDLEFALNPDSFSWLDQRFRHFFDSPYAPLVGGSFSTDVAAEKFKKRAPALAEPDVMAEFIRKMKGGALGLDTDRQKNVFQALEKAFPQSFSQALVKMTERGTNEVFESLRKEFPQASRDAIESLRTLDGDYITMGGLLRHDLMPAIEGTASALNRLSNLKTDGEAGGKGTGTGGGIIDMRNKGKSKTHYITSLNPPKMASGGYVEHEGLVHIHGGERVVPAAKVRRDSGGGAGSVTNHYHFNINVPKGSRAADDPEAFGRFALDYVTQTVQRQRERR